MKIYLVAAMALAFLTAPASAQMGRKATPAEEAKEKATSKIDEKAYKAAVDRIPEPKEKYDPWGGVAPAASAKKK